jgi:hypothetical protein
MSESSEEEEFTGALEEEKEDEEEEEPQQDEDDSASSDDVPLNSLAKQRPAKRSVASYAEDSGDDDEDSDDDDIPLASLVAKKPAAKSKPPLKTKNGNKKSTTTAAAASKKRKTASSSTKTSSTTATSSSSSKKNYEWPSAALYGTESTKGLLIQRLLCRWWYAITWPDPSKLPDKPPKYYDSLDGFPGLYVCTSQPGGGPAANGNKTKTKKVGHILDLRDPDLAPDFTHFAKKPSQELQDLLLKALEQQMEQLIQVEGKGTPTEKELKQLITWTKKVNPTKADKEAVKVLKSQGLELPS